MDVSISAHPGNFENSYQLNEFDLEKAGHLVIQRSVSEGNISKSSSITIEERWSQFAKYAGSEIQSKYENVTFDLVCQYGKHLGRKVINKKISAHTAHNAIHAVNLVMRHWSRETWSLVSATKDCAIPKRPNPKSPAVDVFKQFETAMKAMLRHGYLKSRAIFLLCRYFGMMPHEAASLDVDTAYKHAKDFKKIFLSITTAANPRFVPISNSYQLTVLKNASKQSDEGSIVSQEKWRDFRINEFRTARDILKDQGISGAMQLRAAYILERCQEVEGGARDCKQENWKSSLPFPLPLTVAKEVSKGRMSKYKNVMVKASESLDADYFDEVTIARLSAFEGSGSKNRKKVVTQIKAFVEWVGKPAGELTDEDIHRFIGELICSKATKVSYCYSIKVLLRLFVRDPSTTPTRDAYYAISELLKTLRSTSQSEPSKIEQENI